MGRSFFKKNNFGSMRRNITGPKILSSNKCLSSKIFYPEMPEFLQVAFIDPGTTSCGVRIVRYYIESKEMILIYFSVIDFGGETSVINEHMNQTFSPLMQFLLDCHHVVVEHQILMCEKTYRCFSVVIFYITSFVCPFKMSPILIEVDCQLKTVFLGGPKTKAENNSDEMKQWIFLKKGIWPDNGTIEIKEWTKMKSRKFCCERNDRISYHTLENSLYKGNEDLSDTVCYEYGWLSYLFERRDIYTPFNLNVLFGI